MDRLGMVYRLRPGAKEVYLRAHREIWPEMQDFLKRSDPSPCTMTTVTALLPTARVTPESRDVTHLSRGWTLRSLRERQRRWRGRVGGVRLEGG